MLQERFSKSRSGIEMEAGSDKEKVGLEVSVVGIH